MLFSHHLATLTDRCKARDRGQHRQQQKRFPCRPVAGMHGGGRGCMGGSRFPHATQQQSNTKWEEEDEKRPFPSRIACTHIGIRQKFFDMEKTRPPRPFYMRYFCIEENGFWLTLSFNLCLVIAAPRHRHRPPILEAVAIATLIPNALYTALPDVVHTKTCQNVILFYFKHSQTMCLSLRNEQNKTKIFFNPMVSPHSHTKPTSCPPPPSYVK